MKKIFGKLKKSAKLAILGLLPLVLLGASLADGQTAPAEKAAVESPKKVLSREEFAAALASKFRLLKIRESQLKAMNSCFQRVSGIVLDAKKKGEEISKDRAMELIEEQGLAEASVIAQQLKELTADPFIGDRVQFLLSLEEREEFQKLHQEFLKLEKEIRSDIETAKTMGIDVSTYKGTMSEYARSHIESLMWTSIFTSVQYNSSHE